MNVLYVREGLYMPSGELQINELENKFGRIFEKVVIEDVNSIIKLKSLIDRGEKVYAYLPQCIVDIDSENEYEALQSFMNLGKNIVFFEDIGCFENNKDTKFTIAETLYLQVFLFLQNERKYGALKIKPLNLKYKFPFEKCVDENTEAHTDGDYYVYLWETDFNNDVFYVGSGKGDRYAQVGENCRSKDFMTIFNQIETHPYIVSFGMKENEARTLETNIIKEFVKLGFNLVNRKDNPKRSTKITDSTPEKEKNYMAYWQ